MALEIPTVALFGSQVYNNSKLHSSFVLINVLSLARAKTLIVQ